MTYIEQTEAWRSVDSSASVTVPTDTEDDGSTDTLIFGTDIELYRDNVVLVVDDK
jgi:hypothetical protein